MQVSLDFDERHFEKGGILEQPWKQFLASSDNDNESSDTLKELFQEVNNNRTKHEPVQVPQDVEVVSILEVPAVGPVLQPLGTGIPAWLWVIFGIVVFLLVVALGQGYYYYQIPVKPQFFAPGSEPNAEYISDYLF